MHPRDARALRGGDRARHAVGTALVSADATRATYERMARAMDLEEPRMVWVRDVGTAACVRIDPATAYDRLASRVEAELATSPSYLFRGVLTALLAHAEPLDPRWYPLLVRFLDHGESVVASHVLAKHHVPEAVQAMRQFLEARADANKDWLASFLQPLDAWKDRALVPVVLRMASRGVTYADWRFTQPVAILAATDDASVLPVLRELVPQTKRKAKEALLTAIEHLARNEPAPVLAPKKKRPAKPKP